MEHVSPILSRRILKILETIKPPSEQKKAITQAYESGYFTAFEAASLIQFFHLENS